MSSYFDEHYDVIIIGGALAGLSAALTLAPKHFKILVLEQHNLPGGVATSFVRDGVEFEVALHEMMSIGTKEEPLKVRKFLEDSNVNVDWIRLPNAYRFVEPGVDVQIHSGINGDFSVPAKDIASACNDTDGSIYNELMRFFKLCSCLSNISN